MTPEQFAAEFMVQRLPSRPDKDGQRLSLADIRASTSGRRVAEDEQALAEGSGHGPDR